MKFALMSLLLALIPLGFGCTSTAAKDAPPAATNDGSGVEGIGGVSDQAGANAKSQTPKGPAYLMRLVDYRNGTRMELVNESHTSHVNQYSKVRVDPSRKVTTDDWMKGLVDYLNDQGWSKEEKGGSAPDAAKGSLAWSLQLVGPAGSSFVAAPIGMKGAQATRLITIKNAFIQTYNATPGFQAVRAEPGTLPFKVPEYPDPSLKKKKGG